MDYKPSSASQSAPKLYLPGLHGLRFLAAFSVLYGHLEQGKGWLNYTELLGFPLSPTLAGDGVTFFFVLSGFLITYLLLTEHDINGTIDIPKFYTRRLLRIWPLYYAFTFLVFLVFPHIPFLRFPILDMAIEEDWWKKLVLFIVMSPHVAITLMVPPGLGAPLWSVGVEEYFYVAWPHLVKRFQTWLPWVCLIVILLPYYMRSHGSDFQRTLFMWSRFDCMGWGALGAWISLRHPVWLKRIFSLQIQLLVYGLAMVHIFKMLKYGKFGFWIYSLVYLVIIVNIALNPRSLFKLENRFFRFMGEISYGFYVFHWLAIVICINTMEAFGGIQHGFARSVVLLLSTFSLTTILASCSYRYWESPFLRKKAKHSRVLAGLGARD